VPTWKTIPSCTCGELSFPFLGATGTENGFDESHRRMMIFCIKLLGYPLVNIQKAIENGPVEIVDFPMKNGDFP